MNRRGALLFAAMCVIWGVPYLMIRVAVRELAPVTLVFGRTAIAALLLTPVALYRGELRPLLRLLGAAARLHRGRGRDPLGAARARRDEAHELAHRPPDRRGAARRRGRRDAHRRTRAAGPPQLARAADRHRRRRRDRRPRRRPGERARARRGRRASPSATRSGRSSSRAGSATCPRSESSPRRS